MNTEKNNILIDNEVKRPEQSVVRETILWWERRRYIYNIIVVGFSICLIYAYWNYPMRSIIGTKDIIKEFVFYTICLNLGYSLGWMSGLLMHYVYKTESQSEVYRWALLIVGTLFSLIVVLLGYTFLFDVLFAD